MPASTAVSAARWLAGADFDPAHAQRWWDAIGTALLPAGRRWDVVITNTQDGSKALEAGLEGPVFCDPTEDCYCFLVPAGTSRSWKLEGTRCLGKNCWISVPATTKRTAGVNQGAYWVRPPDGSGVLVDPKLLRAVLEGAS